jgi:lipopolysaccharide export system permease protein
VPQLLSHIPFALRFDRYLVSSIASALLPVVLMLLALFSFLALAEELEDVGEGSYAIIDAVLVVGLTLPNRLLDLLPVMILLGALIGMGGLAGNSELTAVRAAGRSPWELVRPPLMFAALLGLGLLVVAQYLVPLAEQQASQLRAKALGEISQDAEDTWTRSNQQIIKVGEIGGAGHLEDVEIYSFDESGLASVRQVRAVEVLDSQRWQLAGVQLVERSAGTALQQNMVSELWQVDLSEHKLAALALPPRSLSLQDLRGRILRSEANQLDAHGLRVMLWQRLSLPLAAIAMMVLALPFVLGSTRVLSTGERVTFGIIAGVVFYLGEQACAHLAVIYRLNPVLMAILPEVLLLLIVGNWLRRLE